MCVFVLFVRVLRDAEGKEGRRFESKCQLHCTKVFQYFDLIHFENFKFKMERVSGDGDN